MSTTNYAQHIGKRIRREGTMPRDEYEKTAKANAARGQELPQTKLLDMDIVGIRSAAKQRENLRKYIRENLSNAALAKQYGVHIRTIENCVQYHTGSHIP
ncbi:MAG: hypothetical protein KGI54_08825 [Pseudomonadota bacterium]|nr:hypothetical protein [Pseudomonadota bacterium]